MSDSGPTRVPFDVEGYTAAVTSGRGCFICRIARGEEPTASHHQVIYRDSEHFAFFNRFPTLTGYTLVAPLEHHERVVSDFSREEYLRLQALIHRMGRAMAKVLPVERLYVLSLGSQQGNSHVHWHVAALPPGVPYRDQQFAALMAENGYLDIPDEDRDRLADALRRALEEDA